MLFKPARVLTLLGVVLSAATPALQFSVNNDNFQKYIQARCFNDSTTVGQVQPIGLTLENVISMIERFELQNPDLQPQQVIQAFLERFHIDGVLFNGEEEKQSATEFKHAKLTTAILGGVLETHNSDYLERIEKIFTEDEKCNLFFSLSHTVNETALDDEKDENKYHARQEAKAPSLDIGTEIPIPKKPLNTPKPVPVQSQFLGEEQPNVISNKFGSKKLKRATYERRRMRTRHPREYGVVSYLGSITNPIEINRVLLGLYVGYAKLEKQKMSTILSKVGRQMSSNIDDKDVDPLMAVTLSDIYGIFPDKGLSVANLDFFGVEGAWNVTECQTKFVLESNKGKWVTASEFRGAIDGYNIGKAISNFRNLNASQALRFYYSKQGLVEAGICQREDKARDDIRDDLVSQGTAYLHMWNIFNYDSQQLPENIESYGKKIQDYFRSTLDNAKKPSQQESEMCTQRSSGDMNSAVVETQADVYFMFDMAPCTFDQYQRGNRNGQSCDQNSKIVSQIVNKLQLGRHLSSVSVLYNVKALDTPNLVGDDGESVQTQLFSQTFNSTSNQCAACRALDEPLKMDTIEKRKELYALIDKQFNDIKEAQNGRMGNPARVFYWFDYGTVETIPTDKAESLEVYKVLRNLKYVHRDFHYFGIGTNVTVFQDLITEQSNLMTYGKPATEDFISRIFSAPQVLEHPRCNISTSANTTFTGFITPGYKQRWMMSPTQFIKSTDASFQFRSNDHTIEVCVGREANPEIRKENCKKASGPGGEVSFRLGSPCKDKLFEKCQSIYFTVNIASQSNNAPYCLEPECQNIGQARWTLTHKGIRCNGATGLTISMLFIVFAFFIQRFFN